MKSQSKMCGVVVKDCLVGERWRFVGSAQILTRLGGVSFETAGVLFACDCAHQGDRSGCMEIL
ncbi:MAG: hypothetical protein SAL70_40765 [Scytonema sp. PMC 1070.18]|nr:hypothetical protein [Scytonema sp. PMC 1070.18]